MVATIRPTTPGVYVREIATLPPSVAEVATAIPAFIGYTASGFVAGGDNLARISTLLEYEERFGMANPSTFAVTSTADADGNPVINTLERTDAVGTFFMLYYSLSLYFSNGGGPCYVISIGNYSTQLAAADFTAGLNRLDMEDEPTLILFPDALNLTAVEYYALCDDALLRCETLKDRFCIVDVRHADPPQGTDPQLNPVDVFRNTLGLNNLKYGAAYYPYLKTTIPFQYAESGVTTDQGVTPTTTTFGPRTFTSNGLEITYVGAAEDEPSVAIVNDATLTEPAAFIVDPATDKLTITRPNTSTGLQIATKWTDFIATNDAGGFTLVAQGDGSAIPTTTSGISLSADTTAATPGTLDTIRTTNTALYNLVKGALAQTWVTLPPSPAIAGVYATVDRTRGVWKAPANVSLTSVVGPEIRITAVDQDKLNVDPTSGKSINAIRPFTGKGTLVWGARTLAGNDNEWRYVNVRRLFNVIEESIQKAAAFAVFEANDASTWLKVKSMIDSYLFGLWEQGALAGPTPAAAFFVNIGLGKTMTAQDVLEGRMIVRVGVAAVRPAEFIVLEFTHKLQQA